MTRFLTVAAAAAVLALPLATPSFACSAHEKMANAEATSVDLAAAAKKALTPTKADKTEAGQQAPAK
jgi:hypothetical protein